MSVANLNTMPNTMVSPENNIAPETTTNQQLPDQNSSQSTPEATKVVPEKLVSTHFNHIAKKEAALVKEKEAFKKEREVFKQQQSEIDKYKKAWEMVNEISELQKTDAVSAMRKAGFSDADLMNFLSQMQDNSTPEEKAVKLAKSEIEKFKEEQAKLSKEQEARLQEQQKQHEDRTIAKFRSDIGGFIDKNADQYEYCKFFGDQAKGLVYDTISAILEDSGEIIGIEEATSLVESYYENEDNAMNSLRKRAKKEEVVTSDTVSKTTSSLGMPRSSPSRVESKQFVDNRVPTKTLSNKIAASSSSAVQNLSHEQNKQQIIDKYKHLTGR